MLGAAGPDTAFEHESRDYRRVVATGRYLPLHYLLDNRTRRGAAGYDVLSPLVFDDEGVRGVMVNRGWIALGPSREVLPETSAPSGALEVRGRSRRPGAAFLLGDAGYRGDIWPRVVQSIDIGKMEETLGVDLLPFVIELEPTEPYGFDRGWPPHGGLTPRRHRAYAFQWFALALTLVVIYVVVNLRRR